MPRPRSNARSAPGLQKLNSVRRRLRMSDRGAPRSNELPGEPGIQTPLIGAPKRSDPDRS